MGRLCRFLWRLPARTRIHVRSAMTARTAVVLFAVLTALGGPAPCDAQTHDGWLGAFLGRYALGAEAGVRIGPVALLARAEGLPADDHVFSGGLIVPATRGAVSVYGLQLAGGLHCSTTSVSGSARSCVSRWSIVGSTSVGVDFGISDVLSAFAEGGVMYGANRTPQLAGVFGVRLSLNQSVTRDSAQDSGRIFDRNGSATHE